MTDLIVEPIRKPRFDRLDIAAGILMAVLLLTTGIVIALGDQVGLRISDYSPQNTTSSRPTIHVTFDEPVSEAAIKDYFTISPPVVGTFSVNDTQIAFHAAQTLIQGQDYTVTIRAGLMAATGRQLKQNLQWHFQVGAPRVVYLGPVDNIIQNLYLVDPSNPTAQPQKLTTITDGVRSFAVAPDGGSIVYEAILKRASSLYLWDAATGKSSVLYDCKDAVCSNPSWRPDGSAIAFERSDLNTTTNMGASLPRIWIFDMATKTAQPMFTDSQQIGMSPHWSPDGAKIAVYDADANGIIVHDVAAKTDSTIKIDQGQIGDFSPDGKWLYFPKVLLIDPQQYVSHVVLVDITSPRFVQKDLVPDSDLGDDVEAIWMPDSQAMIVARQTPGTQDDVPGPAQIYRIDIATGQISPLVNDLSYSNSNLTISPDGGTLLFQRYAVSKPGARPELWMDNLKTGELKLIATNGALPRWMP